jgi:HSP20 family protein
MLPDIRRYRREGGRPMEQFFGPFFRDLIPNLPWGPESAEGYPIDMHEEENAILVDAEVPGFSRDQIQIDISEGLLTIRAERETPEKEGREHIRERRWAKVERQILLPAMVDEEKAEARLENGVLHLRLPKREEAMGKRIPISE